MSSGCGVFAEKNFCRGDFLLQYVGEYIAGANNITEREQGHFLAQKKKAYPRHYVYHFRHADKHMW